MRVYFWRMKSRWSDAEDSGKTQFVKQNLLKKANFYSCFFERCETALAPASSESPVEIVVFLALPAVEDSLDVEERLPARGVKGGQVGGSHLRKMPVGDCDDDCVKPA